MTNPTIMSKPTTRVGYIDAMRGFTMLLVVFSHIYVPNLTPLNQLFMMFRMPLFFFLSGFISFRAEQSWTGDNLRHRLKDKCRTLLLPALFFGPLCCWAEEGIDVEYFFVTATKSGYWFTVVLFEMLAILYVARYIHARRRRITIEAFAMRFYVVVLVIFLVLSNDLTRNGVANALSIPKLVQYLHFFAFGVLCSCRRERLYALLDSPRRWLVAAGFVILAVWSILTREYMSTAAVGSELLAALLRLLSYSQPVVAGYLGIVTIFGLFRSMERYFAHPRRFQPLQYVGRHTLEVYVLHYFLLLGFTPMFRPYIVDDPNIVVQIVVGLTLSALIAAATLLIGRVLSLDANIHYYVLGSRGERPQSRLRGFFRR